MNKTKNNFNDYYIMKRKGIKLKYLNVFQMDFAHQTLATTTASARTNFMALSAFARMDLQASVAQVMKYLKKKRTKLYIYKGSETY